MKIYISGPITGIKDNNREAFSSMKKILMDMGNDVINPLDISGELESEMDYPSWLDYMIVDVRALLGCDAIYLLKGWEESRGARIEARIASWLGMMSFTDCSNIMDYDLNLRELKYYYRYSIMNIMPDEKLGQFIESFDYTMKENEND